MDAGMHGAVFALLALAMAAGAFALVLRPLWVHGRGTTIALGAGLLVVAAGLYLLVGTPAALDPQSRRAPETVADAIGQLEAALAREPQLAEGWVLLGRAYRADGRMVPARDAFARAAALLPDDPAAQVEAAEARALASPDRRLDDEAVSLLERALAVDPRHQRARWFLGIARRQRGEDAAAAEVWASLLPDVDAATARTLRTQVDEAREAAGLPPLPPVADDAVSPGIRVQVALDPALAARVPDGAVLFVIARAPSGPPMPVAVERVPATGFPLDVVLDDGDAPMPTARLSAAGRVRVEARVSLRGDASPAPGDLAAAPSEATVGDRVDLVIDRVVD